MPIASYPSPPRCAPHADATSAATGKLTKNRTYLNGALAGQAYLKRTRTAMCSHGQCRPGMLREQLQHFSAHSFPPAFVKALWTRSMCTCRCRLAAGTSIRKHGMCSPPLSGVAIASSNDALIYGGPGGAAFRLAGFLGCQFSTSAVGPAALTGSGAGALASSQRTCARPARSCAATIATRAP